MHHLYNVCGSSVSPAALISALSLTGIYDSRHVFHLEAAALRLQPLQLRTLVVALKN
jgi:hypothetical protein